MTAKIISDAMTRHAAETAAEADVNIVPFPAKPANALNWRELLSVKSMAAYVAHNQNVPEATVRAFIEAAFSVTDISTLRRDDFERVIAFLVDMNCELMTN